MLKTFALLAAGRHDQPLRNLVIWHIGFHAVINPLVPLASHVVPENGIVQILGVVSGVVAKLGSPPRGISGPLEQFIDFLRALDGGFAGDEGANLIRERKRTGEVETYATQEFLVGAFLGRNDPQRSQLGQD